MSSLNFFKNIKPITNFTDACDIANYVDAPESCYILLTDIKGSTKAIEAGRYKDVNMVGAACIAACVNTCRADLPFVFGGDGATILIPHEYYDEIALQMAAVRKLSEEYYGLGLRIGMMPMSDIYQRGYSFKLCKYQYSTGAAIYMYGGEGPNAADNIIKNGEYLLDDNEVSTHPNLTGLSCRWQPIKSAGGVVMTLLVQARNQDRNQDRQNEIYRKINDFITNDCKQVSNPIANDAGLKYTWPGFEGFRMAKIVWKQTDPLRAMIAQAFETFVFRIFNRFDITMKGFNACQYKKDMQENSDYRKFDGLLRMVLDCRNEEAQAIEEYLKGLHADGQIYYGIHRSKATLLTCFVESVQPDKHVHFVDGDDGGYALAAKQLKSQISASL